MMDFQIPCATVVRLSKILRTMKYDASAWCNTIRYDNGVAVASNRVILAAENIGGPGGIAHIINDPVLIAQCEKETPFDSVLFINVNDILKFATAKTTLGYTYPGNVCLWSDVPNELNEWRDKVPSQPVTASRGGMVWTADNINDLTASSPSGYIAFEEMIDASRPTIVRDVYDPNWFGMFIPDLHGQKYIPAKLPDWMR